MKCCPTFLEELMTVAPNVSDVSALAQFDGFTNTIVGHVLDVIEKLGRESSIQSLCLVNANIGQIEDLKRMGEKVNGLKLKTLTLVPYIIGNGRNSVQIQLATCYKDSLQHLDVLECVDNVLPQFPCMPQLKALALRPLDDYEPKPINLNRKFPALQTLIMNFEDYGSSNWSLFSSHFEICPAIKSLIVSNLNMEIHTFHDIGRVFPKLTKLSMRVAEDCVEVLRYLWSQMTELESLTIRGYIERKEEMYLDSLFTGIPTQGLQNVRIAVSELVTMTVDERREKILTVLNDHSALPSIRNLMRLRHLDVNVRGGERKQRNNHLTDFTAYLAFYSMDHLKHLNLNQCHLTKTCCEMLTMETGLETWSFRNLEGKHIIPPFVPDGRENEYN